MPPPASAKPIEREWRGGRQRNRDAAERCQRRAASEQHPVGEAACRLAGEASGRHRRREDARPEAADGRIGVQLALEEERAPALGAALDDERDRADEADRDEAVREPQPLLRPACTGAWSVETSSAVRAITTETAIRIVSRPTPALRARPALTAPTSTPIE